MWKKMPHFQESFEKAQAVYFPCSSRPPNSASIILHSFSPPPFRCTKLPVKWINHGGNVKACRFGSCCVVTVRWNKGTCSEVDMSRPLRGRQQSNAHASFTLTRPSPYLHDVSPVRLEVHYPNKRIVYAVPQSKFLHPTAPFQLFPSCCISTVKPQSLPPKFMSTLPACVDASEDAIRHAETRGHAYEMLRACDVTAQPWNIMCIVNISVSAVWSM